MVTLLLGLICLVLATVASQLKRANSRLRQQNRSLQRDLEQAIWRLAECEREAQDKHKNRLQRVVARLLSLGVPGLVLVAAMSTSGFAGAAAITAGLASLGGGFGMLGGIGVLLLLVPVSEALTQYGAPKLMQAVVQGLTAEGESPRSIGEKIERIPGWIISKRVRRNLAEVLNRRGSK